MSCQDKHTYSTFCRANNNALNEPMFFGQNVNVARYDQQKHPIFEKLIEKQLSFFGARKKSIYRPTAMNLPNCQSTKSTFSSVI